MNKFSVILDLDQKPVKKSTLSTLNIQQQLLCPGLRSLPEQFLSQSKFFDSMNYVKIGAACKFDRQFPVDRVRETLQSDVIKHENELFLAKLDEFAYNMLGVVQ